MSDAHWFERPTRTETCSRCRGHGTITLHYSLGPARSPVAGAPPDAILADAGPGADIYAACREAAAIATASGRTVAFEFNDRLVTVDPDEDPDRASRRWWIEAYGETPEESWRRR